jgi:hypothetical protein
LPDFGLEIGGPLHPIPEFELETAPCRRMKGDQRHLEGSRKPDRPVQLLNFVTPAIHLKKRRVKGLNRQNPLEFAEQFNSVMKGEFMIDNHFNPGKTGVSGQGENLRQGEMVQASSGQDKFHVDPGWSTNKTLF